MNNGVLVDTRTLPRDRVGLILGKHVVAEYQTVTRGAHAHQYGFRVTMEAHQGGGAFYVFHVDRYDAQGAQPIGRQISFPSRADCVQMNLMFNNSGRR